MTIIIRLHKVHIQILQDPDVSNEIKGLFREHDMQTIPVSLPPLEVSTYNPSAHVRVPRYMMHSTSSWAVQTNSSCTRPPT